MITTQLHDAIVLCIIEKSFVDGFLEHLEGCTHIVGEHRAGMIGCAGIRGSSSIQVVL